MNIQRSILADVTREYGQFRERYDQAVGRGDYDRADEAMSVMQTIENCVHMNETSTHWRRMVDEIRKRERTNRESRR